MLLISMLRTLGLLIAVCNYFYGLTDSLKFTCGMFEPLTLVDLVVLQSFCHSVFVTFVFFKRAGP